MPLQPGDAAPDFELMTQNPDKKIKLSSLRGKTVVLLFYPMDFSPVCTAELCLFSEKLPIVAQDEKTVVFGVSCDSPFTHAAFKRQYNIVYDLLSDPTRVTTKAYGLFMGEQPFNCGKRATVIIDPAGRIKHIHEQPILEPRTIDAIANAVKSVNVGQAQTSSSTTRRALRNTSDAPTTRSPVTSAIADA